MLRTLNRLVAHVCTPDELDMIDHYQTRAERLADLWVHVVGLMLAAGEVPRIAGAFGLDTSTRANVMSAVYTAQAAVNTTRTVVQAVAPK